MNENYAFVHEVRANPYDETPRLIYADYLEEAGDVRGEFIRVQCELSHLKVGDPARTNLETRERELLAEHAERWLQPLRDLGAEGVSQRCFQRGLIERVRIDSSTLLRNCDSLCETEPALYCFDVRIRDRETIDHIADFAMPSQITSLDLGSNRLSAEEVAAVQRADWTSQIIDLNLQFNRLEDQGVEQLTAIQWPKLTRLNLGANRLGPDAMQSLAIWPSLSQITALQLNVNRTGSVGLRHFVQSPNLSNLIALELASNEIATDGIGLLSGCKSLTSLQRLNLRSNKIEANGLTEILESAVLAKLKELDLRANVQQVGQYGYGSDPGKLPNGIDRLRQHFGDALLI